MKKISNIITVIVLLFILSENCYAQLIPIPGSRESIAGLSYSAQISFGYSNRTKSALYIKASQVGAWLPVDIMQITNEGNLCFQGMNKSDNTCMNLLRENVTYAKWSTNDYNSNFIAKNKIKLITNNTHEIATFHTNLVSFYENLEMTKEDITLRFGLDDGKAYGWIGTTSGNGCILGAGGHASIYLDTNYGTYMGGITPYEATHFKPELKNKYKLFVKGGVLSEDFAISPKSSWSDFVFHRNYRLKPLSEVEYFIKANKHLPDVPSAKEVAENGYSQHDINKVLLQKVEELTLYVIEQQKQIDALKAEKAK